MPVLGGELAGRGREQGAAQWDGRSCAVQVVWGHFLAAQHLPKTSVKK